MPQTPQKQKDRKKREREKERRKRERLSEEDREGDREKRDRKERKSEGSFCQSPQKQETKQKQPILFVMSRVSPPTIPSYYIRWRLKLEGETENMCVCTKERKGVTAYVKVKYKMGQVSGFEFQGF